MVSCPPARNVPSVGVDENRDIYPASQIGVVCDDGVSGYLDAGRRCFVDKSKAGIAQRMHASGEPVSMTASTLGVSRANVYRVLDEQNEVD